MGRLIRALVLGVAVSGCAGPDERASGRMERVEGAPDGAGFRLVPSGRTFVPWGFNYDRDEAVRLIEEYWDSEWAAVEKAFRSMKGLGATVVRLHLQFARFMSGPDRVNEHSLSQLARILALAEETGLYLDLTGLGNYRKKEVPSWYDQAAERDRWAMQARFWEAVASRCAKSPAVFCYNLMNEPVSPAGVQKEWLAGELSGLSYVEVLTKDPGNRSRSQVTREWLSTLLPAVRKHDPKRLVTAGTFFIFAVPTGLSLGTSPKELAESLDFLSVHLYPKEGKVAQELKLLESLRAGKPVVIEETFALGCSPQSFREFLAGSKASASGWISFFWGRTPDDYRRSNDLKDALARQSLETFLEEGKRLRSMK